LGLIVFLWGQKFLYGHADPSDPEKLKKPVLGPLSPEWLIYIGTLPVIALAWYMVQHEHIVLVSQNIMLIFSIVGILAFAMFYHQENTARQNILVAGGIAVVLGTIAALVGTDVISVSEGLTNTMIYLAIAALIGFIVFGFIKHNSDEYGRTVVLMILIVSTIVFWALFEQSAGSMTLYADRVVDRSLAGGGEVRASQFGSLNAGFIMLLAIPFAWLWTFLDRYNANPSVPVKFALGIMFAGFGFGALVFGAESANGAAQVAMIWLVLAYLLHTMGELMLSPVGLSAVTKLSIGRVVGVSMGTWFLATALSETVATRIARLAAIDTSNTEEADPAALLATYTELFEFLMWLGIGTGLFMLLISPVLKRWMHGVR
ncbi:MAG: MFS transporter, partial [Xanthomonadales bacterium]|nr:MFS transporter [Xanthomonadales bacterium]